MENKYLNKMLIQPDYVVVYNVNKNFYYGDTLNKEDYKKLQYDMFIHDTRVKMLIGYAASKSHPNTPVKIYISLDMLNAKCERLEHTYIKVYKSSIDGVVPYEGKHNLFIYSDYNVAILAGKEMAFIDSMDEYVKTVGSKILEYFPDTKFNRNFDFKWLQDKFNTYNDRGYFDKDISQLNDVFKKIFKKAVDNPKETVKNTVNKMKDYTKSGVEQLIKELNNIDIPKQKPEYVKDEKDFALYKELTEEYAVLLKHRNRNGKSRYTVNIINLSLDTNRSFDITFEQFCDIHEILNEKAEGLLKFNSIMDVLGNQIFDEETKNPNPIQSNEFYKEDIQKEEQKTKKSKQKFQVGDKVYNNTGGYGIIVNIKDRKTYDGKKRKIYQVQFDKAGFGHLFDLLSYQLKKA